MIEPECQRLGVRVERHYQTENYTFEADRDLLYRAIVNLLSNALQAMPDGGTLSLDTVLFNGKKGPPQLELRIADTGPGIPPEALKKIFNPFFTTREKGTGLGLAIVQTIIDTHNGEIEVISGEGEGTTIVIRLPLFQFSQGADEDLLV